MAALPENYLGYWTVEQVPLDLDMYHVDDVDLSDPKLSVPTVESFLDFDAEPFTPGAPNYETRVLGAFERSIALQLFFSMIDFC